MEQVHSFLLRQPGKVSILLKRYAFIVLSATAAFVLSCSCSRAGKDSRAVPPVEYAAFIKAYTGGAVTDGTPVRIEFAAPVQGVEAGMEADPELFSFSPSLKGSARWVSASAIEFIPDGSYRPGTAYKATFRLGRTAGFSGPEKFDFSFYAALKEAYISVDGIRIKASDPGKASIYGQIDFSGDVSGEDVMKMLSCKFGGKAIPLSVNRKDGASSFSFIAEGLERGSRDETASLSFNGREYGFNDRETQKVTVPAAGTFKVMDAVLHAGEDPYIEVTFSNPLQQDIDPEGMFALSGTGRFYTKTGDNIVRIYHEKQGEEISLEISSGITDISGTRLGGTFSRKFTDDALKPAVEIPMKGNILPDPDNLLLPFRSVNLSAVDLSIVKIYEDNVLMFLQTNGMDGSSELRRAGRMVYKKKIRLDTDPGKDLHKWQDFSVDLSGLIRQEPGAIYRIRLSFRQEYSIYGQQRDRKGEQSMVNVSSGEMTEEEKAVWDEPYPYYYDNFYDWNLYRWRDRDDPATPSYYMVESRFPERNILSSNLGVIVKGSDSDRLWVAVNDILTAKPVSGAVVSAYSYQLKKIGEAISGKDGFAEIPLGGAKAFAVTARSGNATSYLKVTDGNEKSLSRFDTGGQKITEGIKGFVYGERGVWRPGDTLHVTLIVEDRENRLPGNHPVTAELYTPQGQFYDRQISTNGVNGMYSFHFATKADDPTGSWNAYFKIGEATFHKSLNIETIKPNRLKINLDIKDKILIAAQKTVCTLNASWLTGPAASGLDAKVEMTLRNGNTIFKGYGNYTFTNPASQFTSMSSTILSGKLDGSGKFSAAMTMPYAKDAPGMLSATIVSRVTEPGGDESFTTSTMPFSPYSAYVGVKLPSSEDGCLETDSTHDIAIAVVDRDGNPVSGHKLEYRIYKMKWSWWWESRSESLDSYVNGTSADVISKGEIVSSKSGMKIPFRVDYPEWGRYLVYVKDLTGGHASGGIVYADWPSWRGRADRTDPDGLTMLSFSMDRKSYAPGDEATVFIPAAKEGKALVSLENGNGVMSQTWVSTSQTGETPYKFRITEGMAPNFYVHITLLQPHGNSSNDLPVRMYGVQPVMVDDPATRLYPEISMPDALRPQEGFSVKVKEKNGKAMSYTLAIVDEGLLDITSFKTPDPWSAMYAREALGVRTWDIYDDVVGAFSGRFSPLFSIGGDENVLHSNKRDNRFNPVVKFLGPFSLPSGGSAVHKVTLPMYIGSVKVMVVAGGNGAYGNASRSVPVRSPLMILSSLPGNLGTGEKVSLPVNVFAMEDDVRDVTVKVSVNGAAKIAGQASQSLHFNEAGDRLADFSITTGTTEGTAEIKITAEGNGYSASETISVTVRNPEPAVTSVLRKSISPGKEAEFEYGAFNPSGSSEEWAMLELASFPSIDFSGCFSYVADYGHYCTEQLSSKGLAMLYLADLVPDKDKAIAAESIPQIIKQICSRQLPGGGFAYWPGSSNADEWATSMAGHFLSEASAKGYEVNSTVLKSWKNFQRQCIRNYRESGIYDLRDLVQAYRLYTLALASDPDAGAMNRMKSSENLSGQAAWRLAAAYALSGKKQIAADMVKELKTEVPQYSSSNVTYGSSLRDRAMYLETLILIDDMGQAMKLAGEIAGEFNEGNCYTTQNTAFLSIAMSRLAEKVNTGALDAVVTGKSAEEVKSARATFSKQLDPSTGKVSVKNNSSGAIYAAVTTRRQVPSGTVKAASSGIGLKAGFADIDGQELKPEHLAQGTDIYATITVSNTSGLQDYTSLALTVSAPSGWEIFNSRLLGTETEKPAYTYMDIRDDKVIYYFNLDKGQKKVFTVRFNAAYCGEFTIPSIRCEAMYDPSVYARTASGTTAVISGK